MRAQENALQKKGACQDPVTEWDRYQARATRAETVTRRINLTAKKWSRLNRVLRGAFRC